MDRCTFLSGTAIAVINMPLRGTKDVTLDSVSCKNVIIPGNDLVVIHGFNSFDYDYQSILSTVNQSIALKAFVESHCSEVDRSERLDASVSVSLEVFRRKSLGLTRKIEKIDSSWCHSAYKFTEFIDGEISSSFHVKRSLVGKNANKEPIFFIYFALLPKSTEIELGCWDRTGSVNSTSVIQLKNLSPLMH